MRRHDAITARDATRGAAIVLALAGIVELAVVVAGYQAQFGPVHLVAMHAVITAMLSGYLYSSVADGAPDARIFSILTFGFIGGFGAIVAAAALLRQTAAKSVLQPRTKRKLEDERAAELIESVWNGRAMSGVGVELTPFMTVMAKGSPEEQVDVLGVIARRYHPDFMPVLQAALKSRHLSVRASAAALMTALRLETKERLAIALNALEKEGGAASADILAAATSCARSGLADSMQLRAAQATAVASCRAALRRGHLPQLLIDAYADLLSATGADRELSDLLARSRIRPSREMGQRMIASFMRAGRLDLVQKALREASEPMRLESSLIVFAEPE